MKYLNKYRFISLLLALSLVVAIVTPTIKKNRATLLNPKTTSKPGVLQ